MEPLVRGRLRMADLFVLTSLDQLIFILQMLLPLFQIKLPKGGGQLYWTFPSVSVPRWTPFAGKKTKRIGSDI
jgi:hypothetical protein